MQAKAEDLHASMLAAAEGALEQLLTHKPAAEEITLGEIEALVRVAGEQVMQQWTSHLVHASSAAQAVPGPRCEQCGEEMHYKGRKTKQLTTTTGQVNLQRAYYFCPACHRGVFPPR